MRAWKPSRAVYDAVVHTAGVAKPRDVTLVAAHSWDIQGAARAGLDTVFVRRLEAPNRALAAANGEVPRLDGPEFRALFTPRGAARSRGRA